MTENQLNRFACVLIGIVIGVALFDMIIAFIGRAKQSEITAEPWEAEITELNIKFQNIIKLLEEREIVSKREATDLLYLYQSYEPADYDHPARINNILIELIDSEKVRTKHMTLEDLRRDIDLIMKYFKVEPIKHKAYWSLEPIDPNNKEE